MDKIRELMNKDYHYPDPNDSDFQSKIYQKREFYYHKTPSRGLLTDYKDIKEYRDNFCSGSFSFHKHQTFLANFLNPNTPYQGMLVFHGVGTGKTAGGIVMAEAFKPIIKKHNTKIYILVPGPLFKENWKRELLNATGETYLKEITSQGTYLNPEELENAKRQALNMALQYYRIMSYKTFYRKVLGEKIREKEELGEKVKTSFRKTDTGEIEREVAIDKIENLDNTLLIVDEAHNITGNEYGDAVKKIISSSKNLKVVLMTATPMKDSADDIVSLLNFIRPINSQVERDKIFTSKGFDMQLKPGGKDYLLKMANGYVSYWRGADPFVFAERVDMGAVPKGLKFTKVIQCKMDQLQLDTYKSIEDDVEDALDRKSTAVANFVFPGLSDDKKNLVGYFGKSGMNKLINNLNANKKVLLGLIKNKYFKNEKVDEDKIMYSKDGSTLEGLIFKAPYLKFFSTKFYEAFMNLSKLVNENVGTAFVYSNLVTIGIELFKQVLISNGYLEFNEENEEYTTNDETICYYCGKIKKEQHKGHEFKPGCFMVVTGGSEEGGEEMMPESKKRVIDNVFNNINNKNGSRIKFILGSKVMAEGMTLENIKQTHVLDVHYNLNRVQQVLGRGIRQCKHYKIMNEENPYPKVEIYKYVIHTGNKLTTEEELYRKAELKYILVKEVERIMKEVAVDCPVHYHGNVFPEELKKYKDCKEGEDCPEICDFKKCEYQCYSKKLNNKFYDEKTKTYKKIEKNKLDYNTFTAYLARQEIDTCKNKISEMFKFKYVYNVDDIVDYVKNGFDGEEKDLFDERFVFLGLDEMTPISENDFNNFKDTVYDKYNVSGYIIQRGKYYIFQPFHENEDVPMYYRTTYQKELLNDLSLINYTKTLGEYRETKVKFKEEISKGKDKDEYDFEKVRDYYDKREENDYVGIIDKNISNRKKAIKGEGDIFKIRPKLSKSDKKRGLNVASFKGAVCHVKEKEEIDKIALSLGIKKNELRDSRFNICEKIKDKLLEKEINNKENNTFMIIPANHPKYKFPLNKYK
jgi:superfamily II DNA or RNA helicase